MALRQAVRVPGAGLRMSAVAPVRPVRSVLARAEPPSGAKVTREYREDTGEVTAPGASQTTRRESDGLYVNADGPRPVPRKDNMSKEMKARLRQEYTGLGGAENKAVEEEEEEDDFTLPMPPRMRPVIAAAAVETVEAPAAASAAAVPAAEPAAPAPAAVAAAVAAPAAGDFTARPAGATVTGAQASTSEPATAPPKTHSSKFVVDENENLKSTPEMRAWTWVSISMMGATFAEALNKVNGFDDAVSLGAAVFLAYVMADLGTGVYHWGVDNYGDGNTPVFGRQIAAFQGHHQRPWTITQREFANNLHQVFQPAAYPAAGLLAICPAMSVGWDAWASSFLFLVCMSQQFHAWSHMKKSELSPVVVALQDAGVLISRKQHGAHHRAPFEGNYCIVSGWWNGILDKSRFFRKAEKFIFDYTGIEPRCWEMPTEDWKELERPGASTSA